MSQPKRINRTWSCCKLLGRILLLLLLGCFSVHASLSGGISLTEPVGARQTAMGECFTAFSHDLLALHYNVAGISDLPNLVVSSQYTDSLFGNYNTVLALGFPVHWVGPAGVALSFFNFVGDQMEINYPDGTQATLRSQTETIFSLGYAQLLTPELSTGISLRAFQSTLVENYTARAYTLDLGVLVKNRPWPGFNLGLSLQNIGSEIKYDIAGDKPPTLYKIGLGYTQSLPEQSCLRFGLDCLFPNDNNLQQNIGIEYEWQKSLFLRAGYKLGYDADTFSVGLGIHYFGLVLDYAFSGFVFRDQVQRIGLSYAFESIPSVTAPHK